MSVPDEISTLDALGDVKIKGNLSIEDLVRRQIDRCNMTISSADPETFNANVRALMKHLPGHKYDEINERGEEYNVRSTHYEYPVNTCGHNVGTPNNPFVNVRDHSEWEFLLDIPKPYREKFKNEDGGYDEEEITILSPILVEDVNTDYEKLYRIVLEAFEERGLTWNVISKTAEFGKKKRDLKPYNWLVTQIKDAVVDILTDAREKDSDLNEVTYNNIVEELRKLAPPTPVM